MVLMVVLGGDLISQLSTDSDEAYLAGCIDDRYEQGDRPQSLYRTLPSRLRPEARAGSDAVPSHRHSLRFITAPPYFSGQRSDQV